MLNEVDISVNWSHIVFIVAHSLIGNTVFSEIIYDVYKFNVIVNESRKMITWNVGYQFLPASEKYQFLPRSIHITWQTTIGIKLSNKPNAAHYITNKWFRLNALQLFCISYSENSSHVRDVDNFQTKWIAPYFFSTHNVYNYIKWFTEMKRRWYHQISQNIHWLKKREVN